MAEETINLVINNEMKKVIFEPCCIEPISDCVNCNSKRKNDIHQQKNNRRKTRKISNPTSKIKTNSYQNSTSFREEHQWPESSTAYQPVTMKSIAKPLMPTSSALGLPVFFTVTGRQADGESRTRYLREKRKIETFCLYVG